MVGLFDGLGEFGVRRTAIFAGDYSLKDSYFCVVTITIGSGKGLFEVCVSVVRCSGLDMVES